MARHVYQTAQGGKTTTAPLLRLRTAQEWPQIEAVHEQHAKRVALVPLHAEDLVGVERLQALAAGRTSQH